MQAPTTDACEICRGTEFELLHRQDFVLPGDQHTHYDVSCCTSCGFAFARDIPSAAAYDTYYASNTRYTYEGSKNVSPALAKIHSDNFTFVDQYVSAHSPPLSATASRVLDVGCSTGILLSYFLHGGYESVLGVDPAPECRPIAERLYGVRVETASISSFVPERPFDLVALSSVLEHLPDASTALERIAAWVREDGLVFVVVPDAESFGADLKEPFLEFSVEHIKYFTRGSLERLMANAGFSLVVQRQDVALVNGTSYPAIRALFSKRPPAPATRLAQSDVNPLREYITRSRAKLAKVELTIDALAQSQEAVVVWGVGSLTARLMATTGMERMNIIGFVDSASGLHGQRLHGREIRPPSWLRGKSHTILVSSYVWADVIRQTLVEELAYQGEIVTL